MSEQTPAPKSRKTSKPDVVDAPDEAVTADAPSAEAGTADAPSTAADAHIESTEGAGPESTAAASDGTAAEQAATTEVASGEPAAPAQQVVYVQTPIPPRARGNRLVGVLLALVGAVLFAVVLGVVAGVIFDLQSGELFGTTFGAFLGSAFFWVPVLAFLVGLVLLVLILNRAGWWAHVLGSLILAFGVYFGTIGVLLLIANVFHGSPQPITFAQLTINPLVIAAALVAREVSIWMGLAIAARGRRVKIRNVETRTAWDREQEEKRAEYERAGGAPAA